MYFIEHLWVKMTDLIEWLKKIPLLFLIFFFTSCAVTINIVNATGEASDVVDEVQDQAAEMKYM